jgi:hypothetical protein
MVKNVKRINVKYRKEYLHLESSTFIGIESQNSIVISRRSSLNFTTFTSLYERETTQQQKIVSIDRSQLI